MSVWFVSLCYIFFVLASMSANIALNITRAGRDKFTNPRCVDSSSCTNRNCNGLGGAYCATQDCFECQCQLDTPTFYQNRTSDGHCVKNERFSVSLDDNHSFLAYQYKRRDWKPCMVAEVPDVTTTMCNVIDVKQHWIWTQHSQFLNVYTLKCLQTFEKEDFDVGESSNPKVVLASCNASDPRQIWKCLPGRYGHLVYLAYEIRYLNYGNVRYFVILYSGYGSFSVWGRYGSNKPLCSQVSSYQGCYRYSDGSSMFTIKTEALKDCEKPSYCTNEKDISAPIEATNQNCSIQWEKTEFYNYSQWDYLPASVLEGKPVWLVKLNTETLALKVNLTASQHFGGHILRLYIRCENDGQGENETHCVLIKFSGRFKPSFSVHEMQTTATTAHGLETSATPTAGSKFILISSSTVNRTTTTEPLTPAPSAGRETQTEGSSSTLVIAIVVCVSCLLLLAAGIILFLAFKRGRCRMKKVNETSNDLSYENNHTRAHSSVKSPETTSNPVYALSAIAPTPHDRGPSDGYEMPIKRIASRSCELYEPGTETAETAYSDCALYEPSNVNSGSNDSGLYEPGTNENVYFEPDTVLNNSQPPASELTYDYAKPDGVDLSSGNPLYEEA